MESEREKRLNFVIFWGKYWGKGIPVGLYPSLVELIHVRPVLVLVVMMGWPVMISR
jgi:hypothetical protein